jgi:hypothetical protein
MNPMIAVSALLVAGAATAQNVDPKQAKILKEQRFNVGDGRAGAAFASEDGTIFREETQADGNRIGQYSYIGDDGQTYTVKYSAGKDGFRILEGGHIPSGGQDAAAFNPDYVADDELPAAPEAPIAPVARPIPAPKAAPVPLQALPQQPAEPILEYDQYDDAPVDPNFNPFINPHDPTHRDFRFNKNGATFAPKGQTNSASLVPDCADCAGVNPFVNPFDSSHNQAGILAGHLAGLGARPAPRRTAPAPRPIQQQQPLRAAPRPTAAPRAALPVLQTTTPPSPSFNFPPGTLNLNRFETGFNFDFQS